MTELLLDRCDALLLDLDGTTFRGGQAVPGAPQVVEDIRRGGMPVRFVTNNASRSPAEVAAHLTELGFATGPDEVSTSSQAAAALLTQRPVVGDVLVVGTEALAAEVEAAGLTPVRACSPDVDAVVQGHSPDTGWRNLAEACLAIRDGAFWVACNVDATLPTERGELPGNGALVAALRAATRVEPVVAGKPERPLFDQAARSAGARRPLVVGDRLETDVAGATNTGLDALLVLSGVTTAADLLAAPPGQRPRYLAEDLAGVQRPADELEIGGDRSTWQARVADGAVEVRGGGSPGDPLDLLRAACAAWWAAGEGPVTVRALDEAARSAVAQLGLGEPAGR
ncbi:HAD-IIA family hydrolase [Gandjariella thermophila]|uniref:Acid sugar phosphatase n=1 Tax=Gandjariella thermophila TaxID=1931992 RepID=A0A4D4J9X0_9PSEU|nr:HAD-IIA family hydrolase [Gandjariella thermophila]GDY33615.1 acid sugar phosphatase [Gandjariella thermophila]